MRKFKFDNYVVEVMSAFRGSYINSNGELILDQANNLFIQVSGKNKLEIQASLLEWCSRDAAKNGSDSYRKKIISGINTLLKTDFWEKDMLRIYNRLGNQINHELTLAFIEGAYSMDLLMRPGEQRQTTLQLGVE